MVEARTGACTPQVSKALASGLWSAPDAWLREERRWPSFAPRVERRKLRQDLTSWSPGRPGRLLGENGSHDSLESGAAPRQAHRHVTKALQLARHLGHAPTLAFALWLLGAAHAGRGDEAAALSTAEELLRLSEEQKLVQTGAGALIIGGWALAQSGQAEEGLGRMRAGLEKWNRIGARLWLQPFTCLFAENLLHARRRAEALETLAQALDVGEQTRERWWESRIHHLRGQALLHSGDADSAAASLQAAIQIARAQDAKSWELRAATSLARLWAEQGRHNDAHDLLAPVYDWFTEGFDTPDLQDAKALLDDLS